MRIPHNRRTVSAALLCLGLVITLTVATRFAPAGAAGEAPCYSSVPDALVDPQRCRSFDPEGGQHHLRRGLVHLRHQPDAISGRGVEHRGAVADSGRTTVDLTLTLRIDDGAIVRINGVEAHRFNMPSTAVSFQTRAVVAIITFLASLTGRF